MIVIKSNGSFILGRKVAFSVDLEENNLAGKRSEVKEKLFEKEVEIDGKKYIVKGIESYAVATDYYMDKTALLVEEMQD